MLNNEAWRRQWLTLSLPRVPLIDFTLSNTRRFYSSMGNPTGLKGLMVEHLDLLYFYTDEIQNLGLSFSKKNVIFTAGSEYIIFIFSHVRTCVVMVTSTISQ